MSITQLIDKTVLPTNVTKVKQFFWNVRDARTFERGIGGYYTADTTAVSTTSTTRVTLKTYTFTSSARTNKIRVRVYARVSGATVGSTLYLNINGSDVVPNVNLTNTTSQLRIDYIGDIPSNASITVKVEGVAESGFTLFVDRVYVIAGFGLTSTTSVPILTITAGYYDDYIIKADGNFEYKIRFKWIVFGNKKTTTNVVLTSNLQNKVDLDYSVSGDDGDNVVPIRNGLGDYATSFTISGNVGASGDILIITRIIAQVDITGTGYGHGVFIKETGVANMVIRAYSLAPGITTRLNVSINPFYAGIIHSYHASISSAVVFQSNIPCNAEHSFTNVNTHQDGGQVLGFIDFLNIIVIGT